MQAKSLVTIDKAVGTAYDIDVHPALAPPAVTTHPNPVVLFRLRFEGGGETVVVLSIVQARYLADKLPQAADAAIRLGVNL